MISFDKRKLPQVNPRIEVHIHEHQLLYASEQAAKFANRWFDLDLVLVEASGV